MPLCSLNLSINPFDALKLMRPNFSANDSALVAKTGPVIGTPALWADVNHLKSASSMSVYSSERNRFQLDWNKLLSKLDLIESLFFKIVLSVLDASPCFLAISDFESSPFPTSLIISNFNSNGIAFCFLLLSIFKICVLFSSQYKSELVSHKLHV